MRGEGRELILQVAGGRYCLLSPPTLTSKTTESARNQRWHKTVRPSSAQYFSNSPSLPNNESSRREVSRPAGLTPGVGQHFPGILLFSNYSQSPLTECINMSEDISHHFIISVEKEVSQACRDNEGRTGSRSRSQHGGTESGILRAGIFGKTVETVSVPTFSIFSICVGRYEDIESSVSLPCIGNVISFYSIITNSSYCSYQIHPTTSIISIDCQTAPLSIPLIFFETTF